jgi:hypothetical protein
MIGLVLALVVVAIVFSLLGLIWVGIPVAVVAVILFVLSRWAGAAERPHAGRSAARTRHISLLH